MALVDIDSSVIGEELAARLKDWGVEQLTEVQQQAMDAGVYSGQSAVVCAPTSSGKTLVGELALAAALKDDADALYLVSHRALAEQKYEDFSRRFAEDQFKSHISVALSTGDREEGDIRSRLLISTYEKALGLILAGRVRVSETIVIADELQLLGDKHRGASVETLCTLLRQQQPRQFVGLTAAAENPEEVADWMECEVVRCAERDVALLQHICYDGRRYTVKFGEKDGEAVDDPMEGKGLQPLVRGLVADGLEPVLVFTESRREATEAAEVYSKRCWRDEEGIAVSNQLELFSEPNESSNSLKDNAERRVIFHNADLTSDQRTVIEKALIEGQIDVCFATSTLAAGVNFPIRTVVFSKLFYQWRRDEPRMTLADYRNMSGRAGRLGLHPDGHVFLLPKNEAERAHANGLVTPTNERINSQLVSLSMRRTILGLAAAGAVSEEGEIEQFFRHSFYWHQTEEHNPKRLDNIVEKASKAAEWLVEGGFLSSKADTLSITSLGRATAHSGLLPDTAAGFVQLLADQREALDEQFDDHVVGLLHWIVTCPEFGDGEGQRFLPYPARGDRSASKAALPQHKLLTSLDIGDQKAVACAHGLSLFVTDEGERKIRHVTGIPSGKLHQLAGDVAWVLNGLKRISAAEELGVPQSTVNKLGLLAQQVRFGVPVEGLDVLKIAKRAGVPGFGRQRVMALIAKGMGAIGDILKTTKKDLAELIEGEERAEKLVEALSTDLAEAGVFFASAHLEAADRLGIKEKLVRCNDALGTDYEEAIMDLLREDTAFAVEVVDDGTRQNVPDFILSVGEVGLIIDCKTATKKPALVNKEDAWAVVQKAADFPDDLHRVTLGKPDFDDTSKAKAAAASRITLVKHEVFIEGLLRVLTDEVKASAFVEWLAEPGVTELDRLPGKPTHLAGSA